MNEVDTMTTPIQEIAQEALRRYDFTPDCECRLANVSENTTYRVDDPRTGRSAALRVGRTNYHTPAAVESEIMWIDALRDSGVAHPPKPIAAKDGSRVQLIGSEGQPLRTVVLFEWLPGIAPSEQEDLLPSFKTLGALAAKLHLHGMFWKRPANFERFSHDYDTVLGQKALWGRWQDGLGIGPSERALLNRLDAKIKEDLERLGKDPARFGLTHNDLRLANLLRDGEHLHVIDFDDCGFSWYMYDFATAISFMEADPRIPDLMNAWLTGYNAHRPLTQGEIDTIPTLVMFRRMLLLGWVAFHHDHAIEAQELGVGYTHGTCELAEAFLSGRYLR